MRDDRLTAAQKSVAQRVLREEGEHRTHVIVHLSGAHAYGFPSPDSDLDLKAIHIESTPELLKLRPPAQAANRLEFVDGIEIDYTSNELAQCVHGLLRGDGNMLERVTSRAHLGRSSLGEPLLEHARGTLSKRYHHHYRGFARSQQARLQDAGTASAKRALYVLRTALTGTHLLLERECEPDLTRLHRHYGFPEVDELVELKQAAEQQPLDEGWRARIPASVERAFALLDDALQRSSLPESPSLAAAEALEGWMVEQRVQQLRS